MSDAKIAKDLLLGKKMVEMKRIGTSTVVKFFMRMGNVRKDKKYLSGLANYLTSHLMGYNKNHTSWSIDVLDAPGEESDFVVMQISCVDMRDTDTIVNRFNEYAEVAL